MSSPDRGATRRSLLGTATVGLGAAIGGVVATPAIAYVLAPTTEEAMFSPVSLGPVRTFTAEAGFTPTAAPFVERRGHSESSGLAYVHHTGRGGHDWLAADAMFVVFSNRCTHVGCPVQAGTTGFGCPCHGSQFDREGARIGGPAVRPLDRYQWQIRSDGNLWITQLWSVLVQGGRAHYFSVKSPGQPLAGQVPAFDSDILYPSVTYRQGTPPGG